MWVIPKSIPRCKAAVTVPRSARPGLPSRVAGPWYWHHVWRKFMIHPKLATDVRARTSNLRAHATTRIVRLLFKLSPLRDRTQAALPVLRVGPGAKPKRPRSQRVSRCKFSMRSRISGTATIRGKLIPRSRRKRRMHRRRSTQVDENNGPERVTVEASINPKSQAHLEIYAGSLLGQALLQTHVKARTPISFWKTSI